jgi:hypothetical protein
MRGEETSIELDEAAQEADSYLAAITRIAYLTYTNFRILTDWPVELSLNAVDYYSTVLNNP